MIVKIRRTDYPGAESYWQEFEYAGSGRETAAHIIDELNYRDDLIDVTGKPARRIVWECSCQQAVCGACAMRVNGRPCLACETFIDTEKEPLLTLEPLTKFFVINDLLVDRSIISENAKAAALYAGTCKTPGREEHEHQYLAAKCLKCGLCLEVCPNYDRGQIFYGASFANEAYLLKSVSSERSKEIRAEYATHFAAGCSKSLSCQDICPMHIPTLSSMAKMNRRK